MVKTLEQFFYELGGLSYDNGDYRVVKNKFRENEIQKFVECFMAGTEILLDGKDGKPLTMKGIAETDKGATGKEEIEFHGYQLYDFSDSDGQWYVISFDSEEAIKAYLVSEAGCLNFYSTQMFVFEDGVEKPFEIMFNGDNDTVIPLDPDQTDIPFDIPALQGRIWVRWVDPKELEPLTDEDVAQFKKAILEK